MSIRKTFEGTIKHNVSKTAVRKKLRQGATVGDGDFKMRDGFLYTVVRAISARVNQNWDGWPSEELAKSYLTFIGKPVFVNHQNFDPKLARGRVVAARYVEAGNDKYIEVIQEIDAKRFPLLAKEIRTGGLDSVSMGAEAGFTICSFCGNKATDVPEMCDHVLHSKGKELWNPKTGSKQLVFEECRDLGFFELSYVFDPADETAVVSKVIQANRKTAGVPATPHQAGRLPDDFQYLLAMKTAFTPDHQGTGPTHEVGMGALLEDPYKLQGMGSEDEYKLRTQLADEYASPEAPPAPPELALPGPDWEADFKRRTQESQDYAYRDLHEKHADRQTPNVGAPAVPSSVDTLRGQDQKDSGGEGEDSTNDFKHWVEAPVDFQDPDISLTQRLDQEQENEGLDKGRNVEDVENWEGADHAQNDANSQPQQDLRSLMGSRTPDDFQYLTAMKSMATGPAPVNDGLSSVNERRTRRGTTMAGRETLASRGQNAKQGLRHHAEGPLVDGGDQSENDQGVQEEVFISQTPPAESVELGDDLSGIPNTENNLVARINHNAAQLQRDRARYQALQAARRKQADDGVSEVATTVNPPLPTGHDELRGDDFQSANPNAGVQETQPDDSHRASVQAFRQFDAWLQNGTGKTARQHGDEKYVLRQAARFAQACGQHPAGLFPTLGNTLRQIRSDEGRRRAAMQQRQADVAPSSYDLAAPGGRTDVEKPVSNTTDADAQASQFGDEEFGHNAGDGVADPVLTTGPNEDTGNAGIWAPGDASKTSAQKRATASQAVRCADLFVMAGLVPQDQRYNLIDLHERMSAKQVADRATMAEAFVQVRRADRAAAVRQANKIIAQKVASGSSRGTGTALPPGFGSGRVASMGAPSYQGGANINDPAFDSVTWL